MHIFSYILYLISFLKHKNKNLNETLAMLVLHTQFSILFLEKYPGTKILTIFVGNILWNEFFFQSLKSLGSLKHRPHFTGYEVNAFALFLHNLFYGHKNHFCKGGGCNKGMS